MANTYLTKTFSGAGNMDKWTFSAWVKKSDVGAYGTLFHAKTTGNTNFESLCITTAGNFDWEHYEYTSSSYKARLKTNRLLRDPSAFYHIMCVWDSANATAGDRMRLYVNGVEETSFATDTNPTQNQDSIINGANAHNIGGSGTSLYLSGILSHVHFSDGYALAPTVFGETDATTGEWKILTSPSFTLGTNGFTILKDGNTITDQSSNSNDFSLGGGTLTNTEDCPSNVFATWNPLDNYYPAMTLSYGNTRALTVTNKYTYTPTTLGMTSGKYYAEIKCVAKSSSQIEMIAGITSTSSASTTDELGHFANDYGYYSNTGEYRNNNTLSSYGNSWTQDDIIGIAVDLDNNKLYFSKNGTWQNSGDPTSGATGTGAISITDPTSTPKGAYFFAVTNWSASSNATFDANFGNGYFGSTAISSEGTNASGIGKFEYDVPAGYTALSTKGLNQ